MGGDVAREPIAELMGSAAIVPRFHGPVSVAVMNHSGATTAVGEATLTVALSGGRTTAALSTDVDETEHDPIEALALGTVSRLSTRVLDDGGHRAVESRSCFAIPTVLPRTEGTHYDATLRP